MDQAAFADQKIPGHERERREDANLVRRVQLRTHCHRQEGASTRCLALYIATDSFGLSFRENQLSSALQLSFPIPETPLGANQLNLFNFLPEPTDVQPTQSSTNFYSAFCAFSRIGCNCRQQNTLEH